MKYLSVCSGIEAASVAWEPLGWKPCAFSEIEKFPSAVLAHHWPDAPNLGDLTKHHEWPTFRPELIVGGTPCQAFSVAGLRKGLEDPRGNLTLIFLGLLERERPKWMVWENVPGVLSDKTGAFGAFLGGLAELGYGFAYRILDAQHFGVPQQRRRVFVVGYLGDWRRAGAVLFEPESLRGDSPPSRDKGEEVTGTLGARSCRSIEVQDAKVGHLRVWPARTSKTLTAGFGPRYDFETETFVPVAFDWQGSGTQTTPGASTEKTGALGTSKTPAIAFGVGSKQETGHCLRSGASSVDKPDSSTYIASPSAVRRLTPEECERLQGFPDNHTRIPYRGKPADKCPDGPRYKAIGNSMAVPVMRWIGERIQAAEGLE